MGGRRCGRVCLLIAMLVAIQAVGCSRRHYRIQADDDAYGLIREKTAHAPWSPPFDYSVQPDPRSRLYDPTPPDHPVLPPPYPQLYSYELPELTSRPSAPWALPAAEGMAIDGPRLSDAGSMVPLPAVHAPLGDSGVVHALVTLGAEPESKESTIQFVSHLQPVAGQPAGGAQAGGAQGPVINSQVGDAAAQDPLAQDELPQPGAGDALYDEEAVELELTTIPRSAWESIGDIYIARMLEFESIREEYRRTFGVEPPESLRITAPRLTFPDIVELTLINSREYQTQKENLYLASLRLSLERFDYELKPTPNGVGTAANWAHNIGGGVVVNTLSVPTDVQLDKMLNTGGTLLAQFANSVLLTFNGPDGFAADVSSDLLLNLSQSVFQNDVRFESLTAAERGLIYAARDFASFRKQLFVDLAAQYYQLVLSYRQIEINSQNYFAFVRVFEQNREEYRGGFLERIGLDQFEQQILSGRSSLIQSSTSLERSLDSLKLRIGIPPETAINLDLGELDQLTRRDEAAVNGDLIRRVGRELAAEAADEQPDRISLVNPAIRLVDRLRDSFEFRRRLGLPSGDGERLGIVGARLLIERARLNVADQREELADSEQDEEDETSPIQVFQKTMDLVDAMVELIEQQIQLARLLGAAADDVASLTSRRAELLELAAQLHEELETALANAEIERQAEFVQRAQALLAETEALAANAAQLSEDDAELLTDQQLLERTIELIRFLVAEGEGALGILGDGLAPLDIDLDDAMLTALFQRYDVMTEREMLADDWRRIKYAADDLKSVLNLSAGTTVGTDPDTNRPFDFTFNESRTTAALQFDLPLNRMAQRNAYRQSLLDYQAGLRNLDLLEDNIKLAIRDDFRDLELAKNQYAISVSQAALAFEQVVSTQLEYRLGSAGVIARDITDAQNDYTQALIGVASDHIDYILLRMQLFLDLEELTLADDGFWHELYDENYQPTPAFAPPDFAWPLYGELPPHVHYSKQIRRMIEGTGGHVIYEPYFLLDHSQGQPAMVDPSSPPDTFFEIEPIPTPPGVSDYFEPPPDGG